MITFNQKLLWSLYLSLAVLVFVFIFLIGSFQPLYYFLWVLGVGGYAYRNQKNLTTKLQNFAIHPFVKYIGIGILAILLEETFASTAMHLMRYLSTGAVHTFFADVAQFWMVNLLALPGLLLAWYVLLRNYYYTDTEIFWLAGIFGLYAEKVHLHVMSYPLFAWALIIPTIFTYGLLVLLPKASLVSISNKPANLIWRYTVGILLPIVFSLPLIALLWLIYSHHPTFFPPFGYFEN